jgi:hypothetical protein
MGRQNRVNNSSENNNECRNNDSDSGKKGKIMKYREMGLVFDIAEIPRYIKRRKNAGMKFRSISQYWYRAS